jgi:hypothetical protein
MITVSIKILLLWSLKVLIAARRIVVSAVDSA